MKIHADVSQPARVLGAELAWVPSPLPGVERRMLERDGEEIARVTSIVRYAPGSRFSPHTHTGGEEFLVLEGVFSDDHGDYPAGTYVRNPVGSRHAPFSDPGCVILVKLRWMQPEDQRRVCIDTADPSLWRDSGKCRCLQLHCHCAEEVMLLDLGAGSTLAARDVPGGEELFVISGTARDSTGDLPAQSWLRTPPGTAPAILAVTPCRVYIKRGHLAVPPPSFEAPSATGP